MLSVTSPDTTTLALHTWGDEEAPLVVLVHGLGMSTESWGRVPTLLSSDSRVVAYDLRGHGASAPGARGDYSLEAHAEDLKAVLTSRFAVGRRAVVVGNSLGGGIIVEAARSWDGGAVSGAVFAGSGASGVTVPGLPARGLPAPVGRTLRRTWLDVLRASAVAAKHLRHLDPLADALVRRAAFSEQAPEAAIAQVRTDFLRTRRTALARTTLASVSHDGVRLARHLRVPTLVLHGDRDPEVPAREVHALLRELPDAELVTLPGAAHMLPLTRADDVAAQVRRWLQQTRSAG